MQDGLVSSAGFPVANQDSFQRSEELSIMRPHIEGTAPPCDGYVDFKRAGVSGESTSRLFEQPCYAQSKSDVHVELAYNRSFTLQESM
jgi:hypothetical protein